MKLKRNSQTSTLGARGTLPEHRRAGCWATPFAPCCSHGPQPGQGDFERAQSTCWGMRLQHSRTLKMVCNGPLGSRAGSQIPTAPAQENISALGQPWRKQGAPTPLMLFYAGHPRRPWPQCRRLPMFTHVLVHACGHTHTHISALMAQYRVVP